MLQIVSKGPSFPEPDHHRQKNYKELLKWGNQARFQSNQIFESDNDTRQQQNNPIQKKAAAIHDPKLRLKHNY